MKRKVGVFGFGVKMLQEKKIDLGKVGPLHQPATTY